MQYSWINKNNNKKLVVFLNGWAMNETVIKHLKTGDFDILMIYDYRNIDLDFKQFNFEKYNIKFLIAWSMGVYVANLFNNIFKDFDKKIAINGTSKIIDDNFGIAKKIYNVTVKFLNENSFDKFIKNMFNGGKLNPNIKITRSLSELKDELISIQEFIIKEELKFDEAIISNNDRIVPTKNQIAFWNMKQTPYKLINSTHSIFDMYESRDELCK